jgi:hypothetical protein
MPIRDKNKRTAPKDRLYIADVKEKTMTKGKIFKFSLLSCVAGALLLALGLGSCLNPISFDESMLPTIKVDVSGTIKIDDVAVFWLINRTKNVDVLEFNINRQKLPGEADADYLYPKNVKDMPQAGTSLASYHTPSETLYQISVAYENTDTHITETMHPFTVQFPRAQDYRYYLYWTVDNELVLVNEDKMQELSPDPDKNWPDPQPSSVNAQTLVVFNTTDQSLDGVRFVRNSGSGTGSIYYLQDKPRAKDQARILLSSGDFETTAFYTKNNVQHEVGPKTTIITAETGSMAVRTNYLYFYKTISGGYSLSPVWPPIPNDASPDNSPEDALADDQGILEIINNAIEQRPHSLVARVNINGDQYPDSTSNSPYLNPGEIQKYILPVGPVYVSFKPTDQNYYGMTMERQITAKSVTRLSYVNSLGDPFLFPEDLGHGAGLVRITNNTTGVVTSVTIIDKTNLSNFFSIPWEDFTPPYPIQYAKVGLVPVHGTVDLPLTLEANQIIQVLLETNDGIVVVERNAYLKDQIVDIVINNDTLNPSSRIGSKVTVNNYTNYPTNIVGMYVFNQNIVTSSAVYYLDIPNTGVNSKSVYVLSADGVPIVEGQTYKAILSVYGNGKSALIQKTFSPDGLLYSTNPDSNPRTITLTDADLPDDWKIFEAVTNITTTPSPYTVNVYYTTDVDGVSNPVVTYSGDFNLKNVVTVVPSTATTQGPIEWTLKSGGDGKVTVNSDGSFLVDKGDRFVPAGPARTVTVEARIENAAGTAGSRSPFTDDVEILLVYHREGYTEKTVSNFGLITGTVEIQANSHMLDLRNLVDFIDPADAYVDGVQITANNLVWSFVGNDRGSSINGSLLTTGATEGEITVRATMPGKNASNHNITTNGADIRKERKISIIEDTSHFVPITGITMQSGFSGRLDYYTETVYGIKTVWQSDTLALGVVFDPFNATKQSPLNWSFSGSVDSVIALGTSPDRLTVTTGATLSGSLPTSVKVKVTIPDGKGLLPAEDYVSPDFTINLVEHHYRPVQSTEIALTTGTVNVGGTIQLSTLVTAFPADAKYDNSPLTKADLVWSIENGGSYGSLSPDKLAVNGTAAGTVTVRATLSADKNRGTAVTKTTTITVTAPQPSYPTSVILRIFKFDEDNKSSDKITGLYAANAYYPSISEAVKRTGHTGTWWAKGNDSKTKGNFEKEYMNLTTYPYGWQKVTGLSISDGGYYDVSINWPVSGHTGRNIFFIEGDNYKRGYANRYRTESVTPEGNYVFYLDFKYIYDHYLIPMMPVNGYTEVNPNTPGAVYVVPIYYNSYRNVGAIMKSRGVGYAPVADYSDLTKYPGDK